MTKAKIKVNPIEGYIMMNEQLIVESSQMVAKTLAFLIENGGKAATRDDIMKSAWQGVIVTPRSIDWAVMMIRKAIGKSYIRTVLNVGYGLNHTDQFEIID